MMKLKTLMSPMLLSLVLLAGCGESILDQNMHLGVENKTRPLAVICEPPEVAPGDTVTVTIQYQTPHPDEVDARWRVALDYNLGMYESDVVERRIVDLDATIEIGAPIVDDHKLVTQTFAYVVPDSALLWTSALPDRLTDEAMIMLASNLIDPEFGDPMEKAVVEAYLADLDADDLATMDPMQRAAAWRLSDLFACQIRFRCKLQDHAVIDVKRNLTIRHSRRLESPNVNENAFVTEFSVAATSRKDVKPEDLDSLSGVQWYYFIDDGVSVAPRIEVPYHAGWTYYAFLRQRGQQYSSPYSVDTTLSEMADEAWYFYRMDDPDSAHRLFVNEDGEEAEMYDLDEWARMQPPSGESTYRLYACGRDERSEWVAYHATPGLTMVIGELVFVRP